MSDTKRSPIRSDDDILRDRIAFARQCNPGLADERLAHYLVGVPAADIARMV